MAESIGEKAFDSTKWMKMKPHRYQDEDFIGSPPSHEDGGFLHLRLPHQHQKPRLSTFDRINTELGFAAKNGGKDVNSLTNPFSICTTSQQQSSCNDPSNFAVGATIAVTSKGLVVQKVSDCLSTPQTIIQNSLIQSSPFINLPPKFGEECSSAVEHCITVNKTNVYEVAERITSGQQQMTESTYSREQNMNIFPSLNKFEDSATLSDPGEHYTTVDKSVDHRMTKIHPSISEPSLADHKISLAAKVKSLQLPIDDTPFSTPCSTPFTSPLPTPQSSPKVQRKINTVVMDKPSGFNSYFCKSSFFSTGTGQVPPSASEGSSPMQQRQQLDVANKMANDDHKLQTSKRKPKPSNLREMNIWAPTSM